MINLLLTGFEPWGAHARNPSREIAAALDGQEIAGIRVRSLILPVSVSAAWERLRAELGDARPHAILSLGLACGRRGPEIEAGAANVLDFAEPDVDGVQPRDASVVTGAIMHRQSTLPVPRIAEAMRAAGFEARVSESAGTYVCNATLYRVLHAFPEIPGGFLHLPCLPGECEKEDVIRLPLEAQIEAVRAAITAISPGRAAVGQRQGS